MGSMFVEKAIKAKLQLGTTVEDRAESTFVCPRCGGPAEMETFWSTSPNRPGLKILKRQIFCGKRPRRGFRNRPGTNCPVVVEEIGTEAISETPRKLQLTIVRPDPPLPEGEPPSMNPTEQPAENREGVSLGRGRLPAELRQQILQLAADGLPPDDIAVQVGRSPAAVRKVLAADEVAEGQALELDQVIEFLASLPDEGLDEVAQLARLQRQRDQLRSSLEIRLQDLKRNR
jgi:hypothetical protein